MILLQMSPEDYGVWMPSSFGEWLGFIATVIIYVAWHYWWIWLPIIGIAIVLQIRRRA